MSKKGLTLEKAADLTKSSTSKTSNAWHQAREDARITGELSDKTAQTPSSRAGNEPNSSTWGSFFTRLTGKK